MKHGQAATGVNESGLYSEFENKEDLFVAALRRYLETGPALRILERAPYGFGNIEQFLLHAPTFSLDHAGCLSISSTRDIATLHEEAVRLISRFNDWRMKAIRAMSRRRSHRIAWRRYAISYGPFFGLCIDVNLHADSLQHERRVQNIMSLLRDAVRPKGAAR